MGWSGTVKVEEMSLDKAIEHGKEKRKEYRGDKSVDRSCRNHGSDDWCFRNRTYKVKKQEDSMNEKLREYEEEYDEKQENTTSGDENNG